MRLPGHSGCKFSFYDNLKVAVKDTAGVYPHERFLSQIKKQEEFYQAHIDDPVYGTPQVHGIFTSNGKIHMVMELINGLDFIEFLAKANKSDIEKVTTQLGDFVENYLKQSGNRWINEAVFFKKYDNIVIQLDAETAKRLNDYAPCFMPKGQVLVPLGPCHGDLTLSNMIIQRGRIILLDFMDTYLDSPIQDIVKLRQDTKHHWTTRRYPENFDETTVCSRLTVMDNQLTTRFKNELSLYDYRLFQFMNFIRILPYAKNSETIEYVFKEIERV